MSTIVQQDPALIEQNPPLVAGGPEYHDLTEEICSVVEPEVGQTPMKYWIVLSITASITLLLGAMLTYLVATGIGVWGNNKPVGWAWDITNFVFWIGIGHAGTLISAILFLFRQKWRTSINRSAEAMTLFAVMCAGIFPLFHTGRPWRAFYWLFPIPNTDINMWQNFRSPLIWDVFAVSTYFTVSLLFWFTGLVPDLATLRDRATNKIRQVVFGFLSLGWRGSARHWRHYEAAYLILAGLSTPLVLSVHSVVSFDFATSVIPGWHTTIFPPYFVAGAIFSGFACVMTLLLIARWTLNLQNLITMKHLENMNKIILVTGSVVGYAYACEFFIAWYSGNIYERFTFLNRAFGPYWWAAWSMYTCNVFIPQLYWFKKMRTNLWVMFIISITTNIGMWFERFVIIATSLTRDFLPTSWGYFHPTWVDMCTFLGTIGLFLTLFLLFARFLPMIAISEVKGVRAIEKHSFAAGPHGARRERFTNMAHEETTGLSAPTPLDLLKEKLGLGPDKVYAVMGDFAEPDQLVEAGRKIRSLGYTKLDAMSPFPVHGIDDAIGIPRSKIGWIVVCAAIAGILTAQGLIYYVGVINYPLVIGGKPLFDFTFSIPPTFELAVLFSALCTFLCTWGLNGLPRLYHPSLNYKKANGASDDRFILVIESDDPKFDPQQTAADLAGVGAANVEVVEG